MEKCYQKAHWILLGIALVCLAASFFVEYALKISPCMLCKLQRIPYFATAALAFIGLFIPFKQALIRLTQVFFLTGVIMASYHTCVQFHFLASSCQTKKIEQTGPSWRVLGLPPPLYNGVISLAVLIGSEIFLVRSRKKY